MTSTIDAELLSRFSATFAGRATAHGYLILNQDGTKTAKTYQLPAPDDAYEKHLKGEGHPFGVIMIREDDTCLFGAIDYDDDGVDHFELEAKIVAHQLPLVVCRSRSGAAHLFLFLREPVAAKIVVDCLKKFREVLGIEKNPNGSPSEIFPKQVKVSPGGTGNWINIPYYDHETTTRYAVAGQRALSLAEFLDKAVDRSVSETDLLEWSDPALGPFRDGPPCLQEYHKRGCPEGGRNNALLNVGIFFRASEPGMWQDRLREYNDNIEAPVDYRELGQITRNLDKHDGYVYTCKQHPIESLCKKKECKKQKYGIGFFKKKAQLDALPELGNLIKIVPANPLTGIPDPPRYRLTVNNVVLECTGEQLFNPRAFCRLLAQSELNLLVDPPKEFEWNELLRKMLLEVKIEETPEEAGLRGQLLTHFNTFLATRHKSDTVDDVLLGRAASDGNGRVYFCGLDFGAFLIRRGFRDYETSQIYAILQRSQNMTHEMRTLKGKKISLWSVPEPTNEQSESFDHPPDRVSRPY